MNARRFAHARQKSGSLCLWFPLARNAPGECEHVSDRDPKLTRYFAIQVDARQSTGQRRVFFGYEPKLGTAMRDGHWKMQTKGDAVELYDLSQDNKETTNLAEKYPERTAEMKAAIAKWKLEVTPEPKTEK